MTTREALSKVDYIVAARLGDPAHSHVLALMRAEYTNRDGRMVPTELRLERLEEQPGPPTELAARLAKIRPLAIERSQAALGTAKIIVDVSRSPEAWHGILARTPVSTFICVTTGGRAVPSVPFWNLGRLNLLSRLAAEVAEGRVRVAAAPDPGPLVWDVARVREALAGARLPPPPAETDSFLTETTTLDDAALAIASACWFAQYCPSVDYEEARYAVAQ